MFSEIFERQNTRSINKVLLIYFIKFELNKSIVSTQCVYSHTGNNFKSAFTKFGSIQLSGVRVRKDVN